MLLSMVIHWWCQSDHRKSPRVAVVLRTASAIRETSEFAASISAIAACGEAGDGKIHASPNEINRERKIANP